MVNDLYFMFNAKNKVAQTNYVCSIALRLTLHLADFWSTVKKNYNEKKNYERAIALCSSRFSLVVSILNKYFKM